jgi:hypothetical protein
VSSALWDLWPDITSVGRLLRESYGLGSCGALSDERTGLQFAVQSLSGPSRAEPVTILCCLIWDWPNLEGQVPVFITPRNRMAWGWASVMIVALRLHSILQFARLLDKLFTVLPGRPLFHHHRRMFLRNVLEHEAEKNDATVPHATYSNGSRCNLEQHQQPEKAFRYFNQFFQSNAL